MNKNKKIIEKLEAVIRELEDGGNRAEFLDDDESWCMSGWKYDDVKKEFVKLKASYKYKYFYQPGSMIIYRIRK